MKKLKKSMLAIIIGVCTVVVALSTVLAVVLLRKGDDGNPPPKKPAADAEYQLTPAQLDLVNAVNAKNKAEAEADRKELLVFDESKFVDENGNAIDMENILGVSDYGFIAMTGGTDQEFYFLGSKHFYMPIQKCSSCGLIMTEKSSPVLPVVTAGLVNMFGIYRSAIVAEMSGVFDQHAGL